jgi:hypothetical protein
MRRRHLLFSIPLAGGFAGSRADEGAPGPRHKISAAALYEALSARFPARAGVRGLLEIELGSPRLLLLPARQQLGAGLQVELRGIRLPAQAGSGEVEVAFGLRYEPADRSVRAVRPEVLGVSWPGFSAQDRQAAQNLLAAVLGQVDEVVLHRLSAGDLALPQAMGLQPRELQVLDDGVLVLFGPASPR